MRSSGLYGGVPRKEELRLTFCQEMVAFMSQCFSNLDMPVSHWGDCWNADSESVGPGWGLRICVSDKLPGDAQALAHA